MTVKKLFALLLGLAMLLSAGACGDFVSILPGTEYSLPESVDAEAEAEEGPVFTEKVLLTFLGLGSFAESYYSDTPVALSYQSVSGGTRGCRAYVFDRSSIIAACDALRRMRVVERLEEAPPVDGEYTLTMADGVEYVFSFGSMEDGTRTITTQSGSYMLTGGEALWEISFPAYSDDFDLFDLYFSDEIRSFADNFYSDTPVSVGYRMSSGATITTEDPELIRSVFRALAGARVTVVEDYPDQNIDLNQTVDYIFTMSDGRYYTFSFAQQCLAVKAVSRFDTVYYWMEGLSELWDIQIRSDNNVGQFEGGAVAELRDDIRTCARVVNGESEVLSVAGVFVEYDIDGESGYLTLSEDTADSFLQRVLSVTVSPETVEEPAGSTVTISVTLSDLSGPILYFTGDSIQQVVGRSYACDSGDMESLRGLILELAAEGNNTAEVSEGGTD